MFQQTAALWRRLTCRSQPKREVGLLEDERRVWVRYPSCLETELKPVAEEANLHRSAQIRDVSVGGINLIVEEAFEPGTLLTVTLPGGNQSSMAVLACVVHYHSLDANHYSIGCSFLAPLNERQFGAFGMDPDSPEENNRAGERYPCNMRAFWQLASDLETPPTEACVLNVSYTGMALQLDRDLPAGTLISAQLCGSKWPEPLTLLACVVQVHTKSDGRQITGCNFIRELSECDLQRLL